MTKFCFARTAGRLLYCRVSICALDIAARPAPTAADEVKRGRRAGKAALVKKKSRPLYENNARKLSQHVLAESNEACRTEENIF